MKWKKVENLIINQKKFSNVQDSESGPTIRPNKALLYFNLS